MRKARVADRYRRRFGVAPLDPSPDELHRIESLVDLEPVAGALRAALRELPASQQWALWLRIVDQHSYRDIARQLGCSEGAARVRVSRGLTRLADLMDVT